MIGRRSGPGGGSDTFDRPRRIEDVRLDVQHPRGGDGGPALSSQTAVDAPLCFTCGIRMRPAGSCYVCESCGSTSGCS